MDRRRYDLHVLHVFWCCCTCSTGQSAHRLEKLMQNMAPSCITTACFGAFHFVIKQPHTIVYVRVCMHLCSFVCNYVFMYVCVNALVCLYVFMYVCIYVCVCMCMYDVCMYVCTYDIIVRIIKKRKSQANNPNEKLAH
jgi:hypothetical protein